MTSQDIKNAILLLAMQGKLVPQDSSEGTGIELCKQIKSKRISTTTRKTTPEKSRAEITDEMQPFEIPDSWAWEYPEELATVVVGATPSTDVPSFWDNGTIPWLPSGCCQDCDVLSTETTIKRISQSAYDSCSTKMMPADTVLVALTGATAGKVGLLRFEACGNQSVVGITVDNQLLPEFIYYQLMARRGEILRDCVGSAQPHISKKYITQMILAIPPYAEQKRIVERIKVLLPLVEEYGKAEEQLTALNTGFPDKLRKSILQQAIQGKLTERDPADEPASELLKRIRAEKERLIKEGKIKKEKPLPPITEEEMPFEIPDGWAVIRIGEVGVYKKGPFGSSITKNMFVPKGPDSVKVYEQKNAIQKDHTLGEYYIRRSYFNEKMRGFEVFPGDVIVSCAGTIGETYVMPYGIEQGIINQALMRMKIVPSLNLDYFLLYFDYVLKKSAQGSSKGSAIKNIPPFDVFKKMVLPLPPLAEQQRIVDRVNELLAVCDELK